MNYLPHKNGAPLRCGAIVGILLALLAPPARGQTFYSVTDLGPGRAYAINDLGHVAGETELRNGDLHAFLWTPDGLTDLMTMGGRSSRAFDLNTNGWIVGESDDTNGVTRACLWRDGAVEALDEGASTAYAVNDAGSIAGVVLETACFWPEPGAVARKLTAAGAIGIAFDLNRAGVVVGQAEIGGAEEPVSRAFYFADGVTAPLADLGRGLSSSGQAVNDAGLIAGFFESRPGQTHAFCFDAGRGLRDIDTMNNAYSAAYAVNAAGDAVGVMFRGPSEDDEAFIWTAGEMYNLNDLLDTREPWRLVEARDLNDAGQIVGYGIKGDREHAFLLTPLNGVGGRLPHVRLAGPAPDAAFVEPASLSFEAEVRSEHAIRRVTFFANGEALATVTQAPFRWTWTDAPGGDYDVLARAFDARGQMGVSPRLRVSVAFREPAAPPTETAPPAEPALPPGADAP